MKGILREMNDPAHGGSPDKAIEHFWSGAGEQVLDGGAEIDKKPDRRIAEWGAEFENLQSSVPGDAAQTPLKRLRPADTPERAHTPRRIRSRLIRSIPR